MAADTTLLAGLGPRSRLQGWTLFGLLAALLLAVELRLVGLVDWSNADDVRWLMGINWRLAAPYFLLTFSASPLARLWPGRASRWLLANRRYFGLAFAVGASCQLLPIATLAARFPADLADVHSASSQFGEDAIFVTLALMSVTSFRFASRHLSHAAWRRLHATGMYLLAGLYTVTYVYSMLNEPDTTYVFLGVAFVLAWAARAAVWWQRRAELRGPRLSWALAALTSGAMLASWSYFGIESAAALERVLDIAAALACSAFLVSLAAGALARLRPGRVTALLLTERDRFLAAFAIALGWYIAFALAGRATVTMAQSATPPLPLTLPIAVAAAAVSVAVLLPLGRDPAARGGSLASFRPVARVVVAALLAAGLLLGRHGA